jgi:hypothetical protein
MYIVFFFSLCATISILQLLISKESVPNGFCFFQRSSRMLVTATDMTSALTDVVQEGGLFELLSAPFYNAQCRRD